MKYRKKPVEIEAIKWNGSNVEEIKDFCDENAIIYHDLLLDGINCDSRRISIPTLDGIIRLDVGDYVIKEIDGEYYSCTPDIFEMTYEKCE